MFSVQMDMSHYSQVFNNNHHNLHSNRTIRTYKTRIILLVMNRHHSLEIKEILNTFKTSNNSNNSRIVIVRIRSKIKLI
jgi:hypothetical protein